MQARPSTQRLNSTAGSLLGFLHQGPMTGWELVQSVERSIGHFWNVTRSQVYRELHDLQASGLVEAGEAGLRDRRPYQISHEGRQAFTEWIARPPGDELIRFPLLITVFFGQHVDSARLGRYLREHELRHLTRLEAYENLSQALADDSGPALALRFGIEYEKAVLRWFKSLPGYEPIEPQRLC